MHLTLLVASAIVVAAIFIFPRLGSGDDPQSIFSKYYSPFPNQVAPMHGNAPSTYQIAFQLYESGNFQEAVQIFATLPQDEHVQFYQTLSQIALNDTDLSQLAKIASDDKHLYRTDARWYLLLHQLRLGQTTDARKLALSLSRENHQYQQRAEAIADVL